jgi:hypothetical protein
MNNDLSLTIFYKGIRSTVEEGVLSGERIKREKIFAGEMSCRRITEITGYRQGALIELITKRILCQLIHCANRKDTQEQH